MPPGKKREMGKERKARRETKITGENQGEGGRKISRKSEWGSEGGRERGKRKLFGEKEERENSTCTSSAAQLGLALSYVRGERKKVRKRERRERRKNSKERKRKKRVTD